MENAKKFGCIAGIGCGGFLLLIAAFVVVIFMVVVGTIKSSDVFETTMVRAGSHAEVTAVTGTPVSAGWYLLGSMQTSGPSGRADISVPISGPDGEGMVHVAATKTAGQWTYQSMVFESGDTRIDMLE